MVSAAWNMAARMGLLSGSIVLLACQDIAPPEETFDLPRPHSCSDDSDCAGFRCDVEVERCVNPDVGYDQLLLQVVPENTEADPSFGGSQFFRRLTSIVDSSRQRERFDVPAPVRMRGTLRPWAIHPPEIACNPSVRLKLIPHESFLGISTVQYTTISERAFEQNENLSINEYEFDALPVGTYDIYWEDSGEVVVERAEQCEIVPQLFRARSVVTSVDLTLEQSRPDFVRVEIPWQKDLEGWRVDVIHPVTGQRVSTQRVLHEACPYDQPGGLTVWKDGPPCARVQETDLGELIAVANLRIANILNDYGNPDQELLRLRPPVGVHRPTTYFVLLPLIAVESGPAQVPGPVETFSNQERLELWVWEQRDSRRPVEGQVEFVAQALADEPDTVYRVRFKRSVEIEAGGRVTVDLPPGVYTARVYPRSTNTSVYETTVTVWDVSGGAVQGGRVLDVPTAAKVAGRVRFPAGLPTDGAQVRLFPVRPVSGVLSDGALGPRSQTTLADETGRFEFGGVDCRACDGTNGLSYFLRVQPPGSLDLPWLVWPSVLVSSSGTNLGSLPVSYPRHHYGHLGFLRANVSSDEFEGPPLIRAFLLLGRDGNPVAAGTPSCTVVGQGESQCAQRAVQVAQARAAVDGSFELMLPPWQTQETASVSP